MVVNSYDPVILALLETEEGGLRVSLGYIVRPYFTAQGKESLRWLSDLGACHQP